MTQKYCAEEILPTYIEAIKELRLCTLMDPYKWILQEDNDGRNAIWNEPTRENQGIAN